MGQCTMNRKDQWRTIKSKLRSPQDLAEYLEVPIGKLYFLARSNHHFYSRGEKPKSDGRVRVFYKPKGELKRIQTLIDRKILRYALSHPIIHSYRKRRDQLSNAKHHVAKSYVLKVDRKDFFPTITPQTVYKSFRKLGFCSSLANLFTLLCTYEGQLPQGPPTSPAIANLIQIPLATRLNALGKAHKVRPTIFGDDVYVSGSRRVKKLKNLVNRIVEDGGYNVNQEKSKVFSSKEQQLVTGVVVNKKINVQKSYRRNLRAIIHNCRFKGAGDQFNISSQKAKRQIMGKINHVKKLNRCQGEKLEREFKLIDWGI